MGMKGQTTKEKLCLYLWTMPKVHASLTKVYIWGPKTWATMKANWSLRGNGGITAGSHQVMDLKKDLEEKKQQINIVITNITWFHHVTVIIKPSENVYDTIRNSRNLLASALTSLLQYSRAVPLWLSVAHLVKLITWSKCLFKELTSSCCFFKLNSWSLVRA